MNKTILCPACGQSDQVAKVSSLYISGIGLDRSARKGNLKPEGDAASAPGVEMLGLSATELRLLSRRLKPPSAGKGAPFRALHPDLVVLTFSLILPVFIYGIYTSQKGNLVPALILLAAFYGVYLWKRKAMVARYESQLEASRVAKRRAEQRISRWMKLYYCAREDIVFQPGTAKYVPADQMPGLLTWQATETEM